MSLSHTLRRRLGGLSAVVLVVAGIAAWLYAVDEGRWVGRVTTRPETLNLESVEQGNLPVNQFVSLRNHWAVYREHTETFRLDANADGGRRIETLYYPVISDMNPYLLELAGLSRAFGGIDGIPSEEWPRIERMGVLVRTDSVQSLENVPPLIEFPDGLFGTVLHAETDLPGDERSLLAERWPDIDLSRVIIINAGHRPGNVWAMIVYGVLGTLCWALAVWLMVRLMRTPRVTRSQPLAYSGRAASEPVVSQAYPGGEAEGAGASQPYATRSHAASQPYAESQSHDDAAQPQGAPGKRQGWRGKSKGSDEGRPLSYAEALGRYTPQQKPPFGNGVAASRPGEAKGESQSGSSPAIRPRRDD
ncbi:hypothetical protein [Cobetia sp. MC34]|uniref:hypothetical protein n=1 Tax=Cobetia sp. MC34 TaxID=2785080 RepID=UPI001BCA4901|nr:hypothetical protein [Cobetia sp. MC34]MBS4155115.1 hypothetical protein [Cobetia sp. MC34]